MKTVGILHHLGLGDFIDCNGLVRLILKNSEYEKIYIISKENYFDMISYMYEDQPLIEVLPIKNLTKDWQIKLREAFLLMNDVPAEFSEHLYQGTFGSAVSSREIFLAKSKLQEKNVDDILIIGFQNFDWTAVNNDNKNCWEVFYDQLQIPYKVRKDYYEMKRNNEEEFRVLEKLNPLKEPFAFVHDDKERGFVIEPEHVDSKLKIIKNDPTENVFHFAKIIEEAEEIHCMESVYKSLVDVLNPNGKLYFHDFRGHPLGEEGEKKWKVITYEQKLGHYSQS